MVKGICSKTQATDRPLQAMILVGGRGTRLGHACDDVPKPMISVLGVPFVEHLVRFLEKQGVGHFYLLTGYLGEKVASYFENRPRASQGVFTCIQEEEPLGTGGAVKNAIEKAHITGPFLLLNGDSFGVFSVKELRAAASDHDGALVATKIEDTSRFGSLQVSEDDYLEAFIEKRDGAGAGLINSGIYYLKPSLFERFSEGQPYSIERDCFPEWLAAGRSFAVKTVPGSFLDIGTPASLAEGPRFVSSLQSEGFM